LGSVIEIYNLACVAEDVSGTRDHELVDACLHALNDILTQNTKTLRDPIRSLERVLLRDDKYPGRAAILKQLVYGECATDGRTKAWLDQYCTSGPSCYNAEVVTMICMEFAKKAGKQEQASGSPNSAITIN